LGGTDIALLQIFRRMEGATSLPLKAGGSGLLYKEKFVEALLYGSVWSGSGLRYPKTQSIRVWRTSAVVALEKLIATGAYTSHKDTRPWSLLDYITALLAHYFTYFLAHTPTHSYTHSLSL
jgi:hypothetical protein